MPTPQGNVSHTYQGKELFFEFFRFLTGQGVAIVANPGSTPVVGETGYTTCTAGQTGCDRNDLTVADPTLVSHVDSNYIFARVERVGNAFQPPPRAVESSIDKFTSASFSITTTYDRAADGLGRQQITEGVLVLVPK